MTPEPALTPTPTNTPIFSTVQDEDTFSSNELFTIDGPVTQWISDFASRYGLGDIYFLSLSVEQWINIAASIILFLVIYFLGKWLLYKGLNQIFKRTPFEADEDLLDLLRPQIQLVCCCFCTSNQPGEIGFP